MKERLEELTRYDLIVVAGKLKIRGRYRKKKSELIESILSFDQDLVKKKLKLAALDKYIVPLMIILLTILGIGLSLLFSIIN